LVVLSPGPENGRPVVSPRRGEGCSKGSATKALRFERALRRRSAVVGNRRNRRPNTLFVIGRCWPNRIVFGSGVANLLPGSAIVRTGTGCSLTNLAKASNGADQLFLGLTRTRLTDRQPRRLTEPGTGSCSPGSSVCGNDHVAEVGDSHTSYWPRTTYQGKSAPVWRRVSVVVDRRRKVGLTCAFVESMPLAVVESYRSRTDFLRTICGP